MLMPLLLAAAQLQAFPIAAERAPPGDPPIHVWFNSNGDYTFGDRAKVYAKSVDDGYLVVLRADVDGRVRVLFPVDPNGDQRVAGGKKYELKGRGGREAFVAEDTLGQGTVLAAYSKTPFRFNEFEKDGHWNSATLSRRTEDVKADPETYLRDMVRRMQAGGERFDYDLATYVVQPRPRYARSAYGDPLFYGYGYPSSFGYGYGYPGSIGYGYGGYPGSFRYGYGSRFGLGRWYGPRYRGGFHSRHR